MGNVVGEKKMKMNDIRVLRNVLGDKIDDNDHDEFVHRKLKQMTVPKLNLGRLPKKDMYGKNLEEGEFASFDTGTPEQREETLSKLTGMKVYEAGLQPRSKSQKDTENEQLEKLDRQIKLKEKQLMLTALTPVPEPEKGKFERGVDAFRSKIATPIVKSLNVRGSGISSIGAFEDKGATDRLSAANLERQYFLRKMREKYGKKGYSTGTDESVRNLVITYGGSREIARLRNLEDNLRAAETSAARSGFTSQNRGGFISSQIRQQSASANIQKLTDFGPRNVEYGQFAPEAVGRLGVNQALQTSDPMNKWAALTGNVGKNDINKITNILGKSPNPGTFNAPDKIKGFTNSKSSYDVRKFLKRK